MPGLDCKPRSELRVGCPGAWRDRRSIPYGDRTDILQPFECTHGMDYVDPLILFDFTPGRVDIGRLDLFPKSRKGQAIVFEQVGIRLYDHLALAPPDM